MDHKKIIVAVVLLSFLCQFFNALAFEATSTSFEVHASAVESVSGRPTSTTYGLTNAGGQTVTGLFSNVNKIYSGILYWLYDLFTPRYEQIHYRWRNDNGTEDTATFTLGEDIQATNVSKNTLQRLRFEVANNGWTRGSAPQFRVEYAETATCSSGSYVAIPTDSSLDWRMATSTNLTDGENTTNVSGGLTDANAVFIAGRVKTTGNTTAAITVTSENFTELEYGIAATTNATDSGTYCFRVTNNGSPTNFVYTQYAKAVLGAGALPGTPGTPTYSNVSTSTLTVNWTAATGADYYKLERTTSTAPLGFSQIATTTFLTYNDAGLSPSTTYWYKVRGTNGSGDGPYSATSSVATSGGGGITTLGDGTNPSSASLAPGGSATYVDAFTFQTDSGTDYVSSVTVTLANGTWAGISLLEITNDGGSTVYGSVANPSGNVLAISLSPSITATTTSTQYKIRITPKTHANMPAPSGVAYTTTARITAWTGSNSQSGSDAESATITIDNLSPAGVGSVSGEAGGTSIIDAIFGRISGTVYSTITITISLGGETKTITITPVGSIY